MRKLLSVSGERIYKKITIVVVMPDGKRKAAIFRAEPGKGMTDDHITKLLMQQAQRCETLVPEFEWRLVALPNMQYNFIAEPKKEQPVA